MKAIDTQTALGAAFFTVAPALLASITPTLGLACLPLLVSLFALRRGYSWGAFALLGGATCLATMGITELLPWPTVLASAGAFLTCGVVMPHLWRFDKAATTILVTSTIVLGTAAGVFVERLQSTTVSCSAPIEEASLVSVNHGSVELANLVGVYQSQTAEHGDALLILNAVGGASFENGNKLEGSFGIGADGGLEIRLGEQTMRFTVVSGGLVGPQGQRYRLMGAQ